VLIAALLSAQGAVAAELLMYETAGCPWCQRWKSEIGREYLNEVAVLTISEGE